MKAVLAIAAAQARAYRVAPQAVIPLGLIGIFMVEYNRWPLELIIVLTIVSATVWQLCLAAAFGGSAVSSDLAERRLGFFLARPVPPLAYWAGKMAAAFVVAYVTGWLTLVPGLLRWPAVTEPVLTAMAHGMDGLAGVFATAFVVAAAGVAAGAVRSRSGLLIVDVLLLGATATAFFVTLGNSWDAGTSLVVLKYSTRWLLGVALLLLLCAGAAQVTVGRLDLRRGHVVLSTILWTGLLACVLSLHLFSRSLASVTPADLRWPFPVFVDAPRAGTHVVLAGISARWEHLQQPAFLLDEQGRFQSIGGHAGVRRYAWSADGRHLAFSSGALPDFEELFSARPLRSVPGAPSLWTVTFDEPGAVPRRLAGTALGADSVRTLSPSGKHVLIASSAGRYKSVIEVDSGRTVARIADSTPWANATFLSETLVRALSEGLGPGRVVDWDLGAGTLTERGAIALEGQLDQLTRLVPTDDWQRVLRFDGTGLFLHDLDGRLLARLVERGSTRNRAAGGLSEGRFGILEEEPDGLRLRVFDALGRARAEARLHGRFPVTVGGESAPGLLALGVGDDTVFVDLASGELARRELGQLPALRRWYRGERQSPEPGSFATRLFRSNEGLLLLDPKNGTRRVLVQRRPS